MEHMTKTITLTPTWEGLLPALLTVLTDGEAQGQVAVREELTRMARAADVANDATRAKLAAETTLRIVLEAMGPQSIANLIRKAEDAERRGEWQSAVMIWQAADAVTKLLDKPDAFTVGNVAKRLARARDRMGDVLTIG